MHSPKNEKGDGMERSAHRFSFSVLTVLAIIAGCVTVNIYFPAAKVEKTAEKIVDEVYQEKTEPPGQEPAGKPQSWNEPGIFQSITRLARFGPAQAFAEEATTVSNAAIRGLKDQIGQRHQELLPYYRKGQVGIDKDGFLDVRETAGLPEETRQRRQRRPPPTLRRGGESPQPETGPGVPGSADFFEAVAGQSRSRLGCPGGQWQVGSQITVPHGRGLATCAPFHLP